jgi:hypothetical protein
MATPAAASSLAMVSSEIEQTSDTGLARTHRPGAAADDADLCPGTAAAFRQIRVE